MRNIHTDLFILVGQTPVPEPDLIKWGEWMEANDRIVKQTNIGAAFVSTVFLGLNRSFGGHRPMLFETIVFGGEDQMFGRCATWAEAEAQHWRACAEVTAGLAK